MKPAISAPARRQPMATPATAPLESPFLEPDRVAEPVGELKLEALDEVGVASLGTEAGDGGVLCSPDVRRELENGSVDVTVGVAVGLKGKLELEPCKAPDTVYPYPTRFSVVSQ